MGCGCKKKKEQEVVQQPPSNIRLTEVQQTTPQQTVEKPETTQVVQTNN